MKEGAGDSNSNSSEVVIVLQHRQLATTESRNSWPDEMGYEKADTV